jgi:hypothetical protein
VKRIDDLQRRRLQLHAEIATSRAHTSAAAADIRTGAGAALLGLSVARLFGGGTRMRGLLGVGAGVLAAFAARSLARNISPDRRTP